MTAISVARADWVVIIGEGTNHTYSVENKAIQRKGNIRQFWSISNTLIKGLDAKSAVVLNEADCQQQTMRALYMRLHQASNGNGSITGESNIPFDAKVGEAEKKVLSFVCSQ